MRPASISETTSSWPSFARPTAVTSPTWPAPTRKSRMVAHASKRDLAAALPRTSGRLRGPSVEPLSQSDGEPAGDQLGAELGGCRRGGAAGGLGGQPGGRLQGPDEAVLGGGVER